MSPEYRKLREMDRYVYNRCIESAGVVSLNNDLPNKVAAEIEMALISLAISLLEKDQRA